MNSKELDMQELQAAYGLLNAEVRFLTAQIAVKEGALKVGLCNFILHKNGMQMGDLEAIIKHLDAALTNSPAAAKELLEQNERMKVAIKDVLESSNTITEACEKLSKAV